MARSKSFFTLRKGSTKSLTFQTYRDMQITKDRVSTISNPQTGAQMEQRYKIPIVAQARTQLKGLVDHSFEGTAYGWQSLQKFSSLNLQKNALNITALVPKGAMDPGEADYIVSRGSLNSVKVAAVSMSEESDLYGDTIEDNWIGFSGMSPDDYILKTDAIPTEEQVKAFVLRRLLGNSLTRQLSILVEIDTDTYSWVNGSTQHIAPRHQWILYRIDNANSFDVLKCKLIVDIPDSISASVVKPVAIEFDGGYQLVCYVRFGNEEGKYYVAMNTTHFPDEKGKTYEFCFLPAPDAPLFKPAFAAVILSEKRDTTWSRSSQRLVAINPTPVPPSWIDTTYLKSQSASDKFLNNGTDATFITGNAVNTGTNGGDDSEDGSEKPQG